MLLCCCCCSWTCSPRNPHISLVDRQSFTQCIWCDFSQSKLPLTSEIFHGALHSWNLEFTGPTCMSHMYVYDFWNYHFRVGIMNKNMSILAAGSWQTAGGWHFRKLCGKTGVWFSLFFTINSFEVWQVLGQMCDQLRYRYAHSIQKRT